ncbi:TPA: RHS repeat domain-containing protein [Proteus mirabilis]
MQLAQQQQKGRVTRRITAKGYQDYHYDINGRLTQKVVHQHGFRAKTWYYQWNTLNQLVACFNPEGECWRYTYDAFGRRLSKCKVVDNRPITPPNSPFKDKRVQRVDYLWSGDQMVQETPVYADGTPAYDSQIQWLYQPGEITPTARYQRGKLHYVVTDHQGTPREIFSEKGIVSWAGQLNTWGQMAFWQSHDDYADNDPEYTECHFRFVGQYEDKESGLYYNRFRYYDKDTGQYISPDPIGLLGGFNPYGYVHCPTGWVDPFGLSGTAKLFSNQSYKEIEKAPLDQWIVDSFKDGKYKTVVTTQDTYVYRVYGGNAKPGGSFVSDLPASNRIQAKIDAALLPEWKNTRQFEAQILVPKGTTLNVGQVAPQTMKSDAVLQGEATQILLPRDWDPSWIKSTNNIPSR